MTAAVSLLFCNPDLGVSFGGKHGAAYGFLRRIDIFLAERFEHGPMVNTARATNMLVKMLAPDPG